MDKHETEPEYAPVEPINAAKPWPVAAAEHSRLLRPFPVRRLHDRVLYQVLAEANTLRQQAEALLIDPPVAPEDWRDALWRIGMSLETLADVCDAAAPRVLEMVEQADADYARALDAMVCILRGVGADDERMAA
jgi:hypothetical protein